MNGPTPRRANLEYHAGRMTINGGPADVGTKTQLIKLNSQIPHVRLMGLGNSHRED